MNNNNPYFNLLCEKQIREIVLTKAINEGLWKGMHKDTENWWSAEHKIIKEEIKYIEELIND